MIVGMILPYSIPYDPALSYPTFFYPTLPYPVLPYPTLPNLFLLFSVSSFLTVPLPLLLIFYDKELERLKREDEHFARDHDIELRKAETR